VSKLHAVDQELLAMKFAVHMLMLEAPEVIAERYGTSQLSDGASACVIISDVLAAQKQLQVHKRSTCVHRERTPLQVCWSSVHVGGLCPWAYPVTPLRLKSPSRSFMLSSAAAGRLRTCSMPRRRE
jgi:hypothetical protein